jgi:hypothetical protein
MYELSPNTSASHLVIMARGVGLAITTNYSKCLGAEEVLAYPPAILILSH